jgi:hypothetical protein
MCNPEAMETALQKVQSDGTSLTTDAKKYGVP